MPPIAPWLPILLTSSFWIPSPYYWPVRIGSQVKTRYIDVWLVWKSITLHVLAYDANALYPSLPIRPVLWPGDVVIGPLTLKINKVLNSAKMHLCMKFCEAMSQHSWENETISFKHEYRRPTLTSRCDVISDVINIKSTFSGIISDHLSITAAKMNLSKLFQFFKMAAILRSRRIFQPDVSPDIECNG